MTKRSKILLVSAAGIITVTVAIVAIRVIQFSRELDRKIVNLTDEQAKLMLHKELPIGTGKFRVEQFLDEKKWAYADYGSTLKALVYDASHNGLIRTDIQILFSFDSQEELLSFEITDINTGP
jgi:hypothetical protein